MWDLHTHDDERENRQAKKRKYSLAIYLQHPVTVFIILLYAALFISRNWSLW
jgi:hypothetical protein